MDVSFHVFSGTSFIDGAGLCTVPNEPWERNPVI